MPPARAPVIMVKGRPPPVFQRASVAHAARTGSLNRYASPSASAAAWIRRKGRQNRRRAPTPAAQGVGGVAGGAGRGGKLASMPDAYHRSLRAAAVIWWDVSRILGARK